MTRFSRIVTQSAATVANLSVVVVGIAAVGLASLGAISRRRGRCLPAAGCPRPTAACSQKSRCENSHAAISALTAAEAAAPPALKLTALEMLSIRLTAGPVASRQTAMDGLASWFAGLNWQHEHAASSSFARRPWRPHPLHSGRRAGDWRPKRNALARCLVRSGQPAENTHSRPNAGRFSCKASSSGDHKRERGGQWLAIAVQRQWPARCPNS